MNFFHFHSPEVKLEPFRNNFIAFEILCQSRDSKEHSKEATSHEEEEQRLRDQKEAEQWERRLEGGGKKRRRNRKTETIDQSPGLFASYKYGIVGVAIIAFASAVSFIWLS